MNAIEINHPTASILFVDEKQEILDGIKRVLYRKRREWDMECVSSGEEALERIEEKTFDAVVANLHLNGISGVELFSIIRVKHPEIARIFISEDGDMRQLIEILGTAHQLLLKPVDPYLLQDTLVRVMSVRNFLKDANLEKLVRQIHALPSQPWAHLALMEAIATSSLEEIAAIIEKKPTVTARVLQSVNSPFFGVTEPVKTIRQAIRLIGVDILQALVMALEIFSKFPLTGHLQNELDTIFLHSSEVANYARIIALEFTGDEQIASDSYLGGLIHDVGKLVTLTQFNKTYFKIKDYAKRSGISFARAEQEILGADHAKTGAYLLGVWGLPEILVETAAYHHLPGEYYCKGFSPVVAVHIADAVRHNEQNGLNEQIPEGLSLTCLEDLNLMEKIPASIRRIDELRNL